jgi:hypothetical protein
MQLRRCITRGFCNYSTAPSFHLLRVWVITLVQILEMSERVTYSRMSHCSKNCSRSLQSLSSPSLTTSENPLIKAAAAILLSCQAHASSHIASHGLRCLIRLLSHNLNALALSSRVLATLGISKISLDLADVAST